MWSCPAPWTRYGTKPGHTEGLPESVARAIFDGSEKGEEEIFPDPMAEGWRNGAVKALQRWFGSFIEVDPVKQQPCRELRRPLSRGTPSCLSDK